MFRLPDLSQRVAVIGRTGSGKTMFGAFLLSRAAFDRQPFVIVNYKRDGFLNSIPRVKDIDLKEIPRHPGVYMLQPHIGFGKCGSGNVSGFSSMKCCRSRLRSKGARYRPSLHKGVARKYPSLVALSGPGMFHVTYFLRLISSPRFICRQRATAKRLPSMTNAATAPACPNTTHVGMT